MFDPDVTVNAPGPVPTVSCASAAAFTETSPPAPAPNSEAAMLRSLSTPVVGRGELQPPLVHTDLHRARDHTGAGAR